ncbi:MAG: type II toxin-antitoxin system RelE/ParE family toxin [Cyclobacteriaceae bacterium]|nr:type II toxin-antitoxin system RelE/ParE family toxin [Cyclobacteriaceae bacterium SS2]
MKVEFTDPAEDQLRKIHCRYPQDIADRIIEKILQRASSLSDLTNRGRIVEELRFLNKGHRFILEGNYKIIYFQGSEMVFVTDVFDMSQDPQSIKERHQS